MTMTTTHMPTICRIFLTSSICPSALKFFFEVFHIVGSAKPLEYSSGVRGELVRRRKLKDMIAKRVTETESLRVWNVGQWT